MRSVLSATLFAIRDLLRSRAALYIELIALRHQLSVMNRTRPSRVRVHLADRLLWVWVSRWRRDWRSALVLVRPETVIAWHRQGVRLFWT